MVSTSGLAFTPTTTFAEAPTLDVLCVPGGMGINAVLEDASALAWLRVAAARRAM